MKSNNAYYLTVEGETEKWYFQHLQKIINQDDRITATVKFDIKVGQTIHKRVKSIPAPFGAKAFHICDYESNASVHRKKFKHTLEQLNTYKQINSKVIYQLGYSNFSFELWMMIHKNKQNSFIAHRKNYIKGINKAFKEKFEFIDDYKKESNFKKKILSKIELEDVIRAVENGKEIRKMQEENGNKCKCYGKFKYFENAPDMTIHNCVEQILSDCEIIK